MSDRRKTQRSNRSSKNATPTDDFYSPKNPQILQTTFDLLWRDPEQRQIYKVQLYQQQIAHAIRPIGYFWVFKMDTTKYPKIFDNIVITNETTGEPIEGAIEIFENNGYKYACVLSNSVLYKILHHCKKDIYLSAHSKLNAKYKRKYGIKNRDDLINFLKKYNAKNIEEMPHILQLMKTTCKTVDTCKDLHEKMVHTFYERDCQNSGSRTRSNKRPISYSRNRNKRICDYLNYRKNELDVFLSERDVDVDVDVI